MYRVFHDAFANMRKILHQFDQNEEYLRKSARKPRISSSLSPVRKFLHPHNLLAGRDAI